MVTILLKPIDKENWKQAFNLSVHEHQKTFVASNPYSLAQAAYELPGFSETHGLYVDETMVGFALTVVEAEDPQTFWIVRFMIGADHQAKGYGKTALRTLIDYAKAKGSYSAIRLSYELDNEVAKKLYASVGFVEEGVHPEWNEMIACLALAPKQT